MTVAEANRLLENAPSSTEWSAAVNPSLTQAQAVDIVRNAVNAGGRVGSTGHLIPLMEQRVWQVVCNQKQPSESAKAALVKNVRNGEIL